MYIVGTDQPYLGTTTGVIQKVLLHDEQAGPTGHMVHADPKKPRFLILNDYTQKEAVRGQESIIRVVPE